MPIPDELKTILNRIEAGNHTIEDVAALRRLLSLGNDQLVQQLDGKYNINIGQGQNIQIGDRIYVSWSDEAIQALIQAIRTHQNGEPEVNYVRFEEQCCDRQTLNWYLQEVLNRLRERGCREIQQNVMDGSRSLNYVARISGFELSFGPIMMRGEAFFLFSEFALVQMPVLRQFSGQCLELAKKQVNPDAAGQAFYNFRVPTHLCFVIALVDHLEEATAIAVRTTNPFQHSVDPLWYEIPLIYELSQHQLHYYDKASNFWENFRGEIVWQPLRSVIQQILMP